MTIYNAGQFLQASIDSVVAQSYSDWELIAVDDGSNDGSPEVLRTYSDTRIRKFPLEKNIGRTPALRYALERAQGELIAVLDADDISLPDRLARQVDYLDQHPDIGLVGSWAHMVDENGKAFRKFAPPTEPGELMDCLGWTNPIVHSSVMYRRKLAIETGGYPPTIVWAQDFGFFLALARRTQFAMIDDYLCQLRVLSGSMTRSSKNQSLVATEALQLLRLAADTLPLSDKARELNQRSVAVAKIKLGFAMLRSNSPIQGLAMMLHAIVRSPSALWGNGPVRRFWGANY